jgi:predicted nucleic acid-binding Zn ribbon protein
MENFCVCCGTEIPEGRQVCWICESKYVTEDKNDVRASKRTENEVSA